MTNINNFNQIGQEELSNINGGNAGKVIRKGVKLLVKYIGGEVVEELIERSKTPRDIVSPDNSHLQTKHTGRP